MHFFQRITHTKNFKALVIIIFLLVSAIIWFGCRIYSHYIISTNDAYVNANIVQISPQVTGKISRMYVTNNQYVKKGQPLFDIDEKPFQLAVNSLEASLTVGNAELDNALLTKNRVLAIVKKKFLSEFFAKKNLILLYEERIGRGLTLNHMNLVLKTLKT